MKYCLSFCTEIKHSGTHPEERLRDVPICQDREVQTVGPSCPPGMLSQAAGFLGKKGTQAVLIAWGLLDSLGSLFPSGKGGLLGVS